MGWEMGVSYKREGTYACLWLTDVDVWQTPTLQLSTGSQPPALASQYDLWIQGHISGALPLVLWFGEEWLAAWHSSSSFDPLCDPG